ncbi:tRNA (adenosine(37)-N6)-threonylcarbamoyltransferase complex dimerization subunit type 1 TsaB [Pseudonocardia humida]|uniref:tRNA (Adenosine(37)-N6)-threonylcarbamoyltransferase complex dimerization subunit type 1 TsaB n=1 Tax=Pseudonocardia humida TaxID=2800819 RepID=A0ABT0ZW02_9PSEU|nr:tRNA (adenosine(37)-N6)-threonylcarbamoyltransferase complex dimerization subunit type 1 TsaB [Pseudonocardia humida]MCO1654917.1 tRNA (adenosine(37)-N6)-threonylcarbamoyltransferase complex dimerization subunit type 1 TsaB [Pseudonocardia humida]
MLVLAIDTATPAITAGLVELTADAVRPRAARVTENARRHAELLMPGVLAACADAGAKLAEVDAVVTGVGPGPFTGLRVGMVTAAALGDALGVPVHGVGTLDAIAADVAAGEPLVVVTDARRREVYWAAYDGAGTLLDGPHVTAPAALVDRLPELGATAAAGPSAAATGLAVRSTAGPSPVGLVAVAAAALRAGAEPAPLEPLYLRRPDAVPPGQAKKVTTP